MSSGLSSVNAPRQSGLKKPPPPRSIMSLAQDKRPPEKPDQSRPLGLERSECEARAEAPVSSQLSPVCKELTAMSAAMMADTEYSNQAFGVNASENRKKYMNSQRPSAAMLARTHSSPNSEEEASRPEIQRRHSSEDYCTTQPPVYNINNSNISLAVNHHGKDNEKLQESRKENGFGLRNAPVLPTGRLSSFRSHQTSGARMASHHIPEVPFFSSVKDEEFSAGSCLAQPSLPFVTSFCSLALLSPTHPQHTRTLCLALRPSLDLPWSSRNPRQLATGPTPLPHTAEAHTQTHPNKCKQAA
ncbi:hypothetical protein ElyMa_003947000 [Elysia marginata]|uniref:Uncharacterized protein n=1 Tax=Elysia marginata TaxID=1093978 RepID=A0AAV4FU16_9GAST|nr:hypothetical protein ElyMa_003947000 [Elysia marginata]